VEEDDGYLACDAEPFIMDSSEEPMVVCPVEDRDEMDNFPPRDASEESTEVFIEDRPERVLTDGREGAPVSTAVADPRTVLKGRLELYMLMLVFGNVGVVTVADDLSDTDPVASEWSGEVLEVYAEARLLIDAGSVPDLHDDTRLADPWTGYWPC
jgi:hypothetical protein